MTVEIFEPPRYDIIIYGITGFTGRLILRYFIMNEETKLDSTKPHVSWAIGGRNLLKMKEIIVELKKEYSNKIPSVYFDQISLIQANATNRNEMQSLVLQTKVILNVTGPYALYGDFLIEYCIEYGRSYCDLTGELQWMKKIYHTYNTRAVETGSKIVHCCGFESVPVDILVYSLMKQHQNKGITKLIHATTELKGGVSGGTLNSFLNFMEENGFEEIQALQKNPYFLCDQTGEEAKDQEGLQLPSTKLLRYDQHLCRYKSYGFSTPLDTAIVYRTNYLLKYYYGKKIVFESSLALEALWKQLLVVTGLVCFSVLSMFSLTRKLLKKVLPGPGAGPSADLRKTGYFQGVLIGLNKENQEIAKYTVEGNEEPGYQLTSKMISECAICLALNETNELLEKQEITGGGTGTARGTAGGKVGAKGGFYTPASLFGDKLKTRLEKKEILKFQSMM